MTQIKFEIHYLTTEVMELMCAIASATAAPSV